MAADTFHIGLTMAGAISAGAYTAGVLDLLFEALDRHNARYEAGRRGNWEGDLAGHPRHKVVLRVISGTSAGGVSAGLAVAGLIGARNDDDSEDGLQIGARGDGSFTSKAGYRYEYQYILKPLHHVWVEALDLYRETGGKAEGFLTTGDLGDRPVDSALNSEHIDAAATAALTGIAWNGKPYRFLPEDLDLFLTTMNLQGIPYEVGFIEGAREARHSHAMAQHSIVRHFRVSGLGTERHRSHWLDEWRDSGIALPLEAGRAIDFDGVARSAGADGTEVAKRTPWARFKDAALATGAFPVGLAARVIEADAADFGIARVDGAISGGAWPINLKPGLDPDTRPKPTFAPEENGPVQPDLPVRYVAVDGGVANNEPFEFARYTLRQPCEGAEKIAPGDKFLESNPRDPETADRAVLMIDPFPEGPTYSPLDPETARALAGVVPAVSKLFPALVNQARFKPGELIEATDKKVFSRYLLSPSRRERQMAGETAGDADDDGDEAKLGAQAIASGSFGGFGGFFDRSFRAHDYMLGQRNARSFLKRYFELRSDNPVLGMPEEQRAERKMVRVVQAGDDFYDAEMPMPAWPRIGGAELETILEHANERIAKLGTKVLKDLRLSWFLRFALDSVWSYDLLGGAGDKVARALRRTVLHELIRRDQHQDFMELERGVPFLPWQRKVLAAVAAAGHRPIPLALPAAEKKEGRGGRPPADLVSAVEGDEVTAEELRAFLDDPRMRGRVWSAPYRSADDARYTLTVLRPSGAKYLRSTARERLLGLIGRKP